MGWADCGKDSEGRPIGYAYGAVCDYSGCNAKIDRGLAYACGGMHGVGECDYDCEGYFCPKHLTLAEGCKHFICLNCAKEKGSEVSDGR